MFTREQILEIQTKLATLGYRDTDFERLYDIDGKEMIVIIKGNKNMTISVEDMSSGIKKLVEKLIEKGGIATGYSAYEIAVKNGFIGSETDWLNSLKGADGSDGQDGEKGDQGDKGDKGEKGDQGNSGYSGVEGELEVVNNLTQGGEISALSAEMDKRLSLDVNARAIYDTAESLSELL